MSKDSQIEDRLAKLEATFKHLQEDGSAKHAQVVAATCFVVTNDGIQRGFLGAMPDEALFLSFGDASAKPAAAVGMAANGAPEFTCS